MVARVMTHSKLFFMGLAVSLVTLAATLLVHVPAQAQVTASDGAIEMTVSPTKQQLSLQPGQQSEGKFSVLNTGEEQFTFKLYTSPYFVANEQYEPVFNEESSRTQISRWVTMSEDEITLQPGEKHDVGYTVNVPTDVPAGGQYAVLFAETTEEATGESSIVAKKRVGMLVYGTVAGDTRESGEVVSNDIKRWQHTAPLMANVRLKNTGNTDFEASAKMTVSSLFGKTVYESPEGENVLLPDTTRAIDLQWDGATIGIYKVSTTVGLLDDTYAEERYVLVASPLAVLSITIGFVLIVGGIVYGVRKKR